MAAQESAHVTVARVVRPHGLRGEVAAEILTDFPERLVRLATAYLCHHRMEPRRITIRSCRLSPSRGGQAIFHFEGSNSISDAEKLVGLELRIPRVDRMPLPSGSYYISDLIGCEVRHKNGATIGAVRDVQMLGEDVAGTPVLVVDSSQGELLVPLAYDICVNVNIEAHLIEVLLPEGLSALNE